MDVIARPSVTPRSAAAPDVEYFEDFLQGGYVADAALSAESDPAAKFSMVADAGEWFVTRTATGTPTLTVLDDGANGYLKILNGTADNDLTNLQLNGESFKLRAGKMLVFESKFNITDLTYGEFFIGLSITDTAIMGTYVTSGSSDHIGFAMLSAGPSLLYAVDKDNAGTDSSVDTGIDLVDATDVTVRIEIDGISVARFYVDGVLVGTDTANLPDNEAMTPTVELRNYGGTTAAIMNIDYIRVAANR